MIRGVNRQIIEISNTGNQYFERALLFVKPEYTETEDERLRAEADRLIAGLGRPPQSAQSARVRRAKAAACAKRRTRRLIAAAVFAGAVITGYLILAAVLH